MSYYSTISTRKDKQMEKLFSCRTASTHYSYSEAYFRLMLKEKRIDSIKMGYSRRMKKSDLDAHFESKMES